jgi:hypothetical protein
VWVSEWVRVCFGKRRVATVLLGVLTKDVESDVKIGWWSDAIVCRALVDSRLVSINLLQSQGKTFHRSVFAGDGASLEMRRENGMILAFLSVVLNRGVYLYVL